MAENRKTALWARIVYIVLWLIGAKLAMKYVLPLIAPFILAFITAAAIEPIVRRFEARVGVKRWIMSGIVILMLLGGLFGIARIVVTRAAGGVGDIASSLTASLSGLDGIGQRFTRWLDGSIGNCPPQVRDYIDNAIDGAAQHISQLPAEISSSALKALTRFAAHMPDILLFAGTAAVGTFFISSRYGEVRGFLRRQVPEHRRERWDKIKSGIADTILKWLKAELMLMCVTFFELTAGFFLLGTAHPILTALMTALIDALPVLGVGTVLLPWSVFLLLTGRAGAGVGLAALYLVITLMRSLLEPKLVGSELGLNPVATLLAIYTGFKTVGVAGMIFFPMGLMVLKQLNDERIINLWK